MTINFSTKAGTLASIRGRLNSATVLPLICVNFKEWRANKKLLEIIDTCPSWLKSPVIVRSSAQFEDKVNQSMAGSYLSLLNVLGTDEIVSAINSVFDSYGDTVCLEDQVVIQPMLIDVSVSGVVFTRDPANSGHYYIVNYDDSTGSTESVTAGKFNHTKTIYHSKSTDYSGLEWMNSLLVCLKELELLFDCDSLDVEFAFDSNGELYVLQVRQLALSENNYVATLTEHTKLLAEIQTKLSAISVPHPYLYGKKPIYGVMPDWNPAEIIGVRPRQLALSMYKELITDGTWAYQRDNYGYRNLRSFPLIISLSGMPYIDVRVSFNSFIPKSLDEKIAERLVDYYLEALVDAPYNHDKVEFQIIISCYTFDIFDRLEPLKKYGFSDTNIKEFTSSLHLLTNNIINNETGLWKKDIQKLEELKCRQEAIHNSDLDIVSKIYWIIEDCKRYGTLPFAGLARAGFIAVQLLRSLVNVGVLSEEDYQLFLKSLNTVSSEINDDLSVLDKELFLQKYGHLRPGTYDVLSKRYDEAFETYFSTDYTDNKTNNDGSRCFSLSLEAMNKLEILLKEHALDHTVIGLFNFIKGAIEGREYAKFVFTKSLSDSLELMKRLGEANGVSNDNVSHANISIIRHLYSSSENVNKVLSDSIQVGKNMHMQSLQLLLPPLITDIEDIYSFEIPPGEPNYITLGTAYGRVVVNNNTHENLDGSILFIESADPGFDWIFSHNIVGFVTMYGGANSHMAIRASELGIPAVIGAGKVIYNQWNAASFIKIDCANRKVHIIK